MGNFNNFGKIIYNPFLTVSISLASLIFNPDESKCQNGGKWIEIDPVHNVDVYKEGGNIVFEAEGNAYQEEIRKVYDADNVYKKDGVYYVRVSSAESSGHYSGSNSEIGDVVEGVGEIAEFGSDVLDLFSGEGPSGSAENRGTTTLNSSYGGTGNSHNYQGGEKHWAGGSKSKKEEVSRGSNHWAKSSVKGNLLWWQKKEEEAKEIFGEGSGAFGDKGRTLAYVFAEKVPGGEIALDYYKWVKPSLNDNFEDTWDQEVKEANKFFYGNSQGRNYADWQERCYNCKGSNEVSTVFIYKSLPDEIKKKTRKFRQSIEEIVD